MEPQFWHRRWGRGEIGFHQSAVDRHLEKHWPALELAGNSSVFVPLCGKSLDLLWLLGQGCFVAGVELSALALESFCMENGIAARRRTLDRFDLYEAERLELYCGDFFEFSRERMGSVAAVYDRAALISWKPELRARYVAHMTALTEPGTQTLLITMEYPQGQMSGPPFSVTTDEVERLYGRDYSIHPLAKVDILANEARLRARGLTELHEVCYRLARL